MPIDTSEAIHCVQNENIAVSELVPLELAYRIIIISSYCCSTAFPYFVLLSLSAVCVFQFICGELFSIYLVLCFGSVFLSLCCCSLSLLVAHILSFISIICSAHVHLFFGTKNKMCFVSS